MTLEEIKNLRDKNMTFEEIGLIFGVKKQRVWALFTGYTLRYYHTPRYREYKRHLGHSITAKPYKPCSYCEEDKKSMGLSSSL